MAGPQAITVEIEAPPRNVWQALAAELDQRGRHVQVLESRTEEYLRLAVHTTGQVLCYDYRISSPSSCQTVVTASVAPSGGLYTLKRLLTFGAIDRGVLDTLAVGLANLQSYVERDLKPAPSAGGMCEPPKPS